MYFFPFGMFLPLLVVFLVVRAVTRYRRVNNRFAPPSPDDYVGVSRSARVLGGASEDAKIFKLAYKLKGRVTLSDIVVETGMNLQDAQRVVESMGDNAHVRMEVDENLGTVTYEFPEIIRRFETEQ